MRRPRRQPPQAPPERLCRFIAAEWPEALSEPDAFRRWMRAWFGWRLDHTDDPLPENDQEQERIRR